MLYADATTTPAWLTGWLGVVVALLGVLGLVASAAAYLRASYAKATVATLMESNGALEQRVTLLKDEAAAREQEHAKDRVRIDSMERENGILREIVQGKGDIDRISLQVENHHTEIVEDRKRSAREFREQVGIITAHLEDVLAAASAAAATTTAATTELATIRGMVDRMYQATVREAT